MVDCFFFHLVLPLTISSFWLSPLIWRRWVNPYVFIPREPRCPFPSMIPDAKTIFSSRLCSSPFAKILSSSGWQSDWTLSELPHSLLYSSTILDSWWDSKNLSGIVCKKMKKSHDLRLTLVLREFSLYKLMVILCLLPQASIVHTWHCLHGGSCPDHSSLAMIKVESRIVSDCSFRHSTS